MIKAKITKNAAETEKAGEQFAKQLKPQDVIFLMGNLGSGKTTFVKGLARGLGIVSRIISPTFVVVRQHGVGQETGDRRQETEGRSLGIATLYHLDLYRLQSEQEVMNVDLKDYLEDPNAIVAIEWPEISQNIVTKKVWKVKFDIRNDLREITFSYE